MNNATPLDWHACARCKQQFVRLPGAKGPTRSWCKPCRRSYNSCYLRGYKPSRACKACGVQYRGTSLYCCDEHRPAPRRRLNGVCPWCQNTFVANGKGRPKVYCSSQCRRAADNYRTLAKRAETCERECPWCYRTFTTTMSGLKKYCGTPCGSAQAHHVGTWHAPDRCPLPVCMECRCVGGFNPSVKRCPACSVAYLATARGQAMARRRAAELAGEKIHWRPLGERDGWKCHLCGKAVKRVGGGKGQPWGATIDHLVPIVDGGEHKWENVALAHRRCNISRSDGGEVQLRLIG